MTNPTSHPPSRVIAQAGGSGGPVYECRGARIGSNENGTMFNFSLVGFPGGGWSGLGSIEMIVRLVNILLDTGERTHPAGAAFCEG
ncbi:hypothetical protein D9599_05790 [Roseomonas sp. KE2513]|uniref:hypothetical protein n=1 Tax=Roseomonas sp. KE2513 TaxID=2479202 RepID=UPI0018DF44F2|nr:hypothetical protein [Roseomonas sp. KE2513]MBI0535084.1 hypothetical protein [Roseomonas sp. KE2513]